MLWLLWLLQSAVVCGISEAHYSLVPADLNNCQEEDKA